MPTNPYEAPQEKSDRNIRERLTFRVALAVVATCSVLFGGLGASVGWLLGAFVPGYYRGVFSNGDSPGFDPISVGIGQGLTQGIVGGIVVGLVIIAIFAWRESRRFAKAP